MPAQAADIWLVRYTARGAKAWSQTWNGPDGLSDEAEALVTDGRGNVYLAGRTRRDINHWDSLVLKYDAAGHLKWQVIYVADVTGANEATAIGLDSAGDVYIAGTAFRAGGFDAFAAKFRGTDGAHRWTCWYDSGGMDTAGSIAVTGRECYLAGDTEVVGQDSDALLFKVGATGALAWWKTWDDPQAGDDDWDVVRPMRGGGVVVVGSAGEYLSGDAVVARYTAAGLAKWTRTWSSSGTAGDQADDIAVAGDGSIWVGIATARGAGSDRAALVKWSASGAQRFARTIGSGTKPAQFRALTLDGSGNAYLVGALGSAGGGFDALAAKYSAAGKLRWRSTAAFAGNKGDALDDVVLGGPGYLYACGSLAWDADNGRGVVVKIRR